MPSPRSSEQRFAKIDQQHQVEHNRRRQNRVAAQEVDFDLHRIAQPSEDIDVVPTLFVITAWRIIVNANLVENIAVQLGIKLGLQNVLQHAQLRLFLGLERPRIVEHFAVAIAQNVGRDTIRSARACAP